MSIFDRIDPGRIIHDIENGINHIKDDALHGIQSVANDARHGVEQTAQNAQHGIEQVVGNAEHQIEQAVNAAAHEIEQKAQQAAHEAAHLAKEGVAEAAKLAEQEALKKALDKARTLEQLGEAVLEEVAFGFSLSIIAVDYENVGDRIKSIRETLEHYVGNHPDTTVDSIFTFVEAFSPDFVTISVSGEIFTNALGGSFYVKLPLHHWLEQGKTLLQKVL